MSFPSIPEFLRNHQSIYTAVNDADAEPTELRA